MAVVRKALAEWDHIKGFFWDFSSLYQHPPNGRRTAEQEESFKRALGAMADVYASAVGTTVLQLKEIPSCPTEFHGRLSIFGLGQGVNVSDIRSALGTFGDIQECELIGGSQAMVRFAHHEDARNVRRAVEQAISSCVDQANADVSVANALRISCTGADTMYNERSYDGRLEDDERDGDTGRGWCAHPKWPLKPCCTLGRLDEHVLV